MNRIFTAKTKPNKYGNLEIVISRAAGIQSTDREMNAFMHEIAAQLERRADEVGFSGSIDVSLWNNGITVECLPGEEIAAANLALRIISENF